MTQTIRTTEQARQWMDEQGLSSAQVARRFNCSPSLVYELLAGRKRGNRGASHNIAVFLGLKAGQPVATKQANQGRPTQTARTATMAQQGAQA